MNTRRVDVWWRLCRSLAERRRDSSLQETRWKKNRVYRKGSNGGGQKEQVNATRTKKPTTNDLQNMFRRNGERVSSKSARRILKIVDPADSIDCAIYRRRFQTFELADIEREKGQT